MKTKTFLVETYDDDDDVSKTPGFLVKETVGGNINVDFYDFHSFPKMQII